MSFDSLSCPGLGWADDESATHAVNLELVAEPALRRCATIKMSVLRVVAGNAETNSRGDPTTTTVGLAINLVTVAVPRPPPPSPFTSGTTHYAGLIN